MQDFIGVLVPLLIIMDPLGNLPFFLLFTRDNTQDERRRMALVAAVASAVILMTFALSGDVLLRLFHISMPAFQLAGGFIFFIYALQMLALIPSGIKTSAEEEQEGIRKDNIALVPLAIPLLAGPGAITAVLVWRQQLTAPVQQLQLLAAILLACLIVYLALRFAGTLRRLLGVSGIRVVTRLMGLLLAVIAVEFMVQGWRQI
ncbi:MarC family protein [Sulfurivermis fontis]|uniref:MarC family protein n=1 Tax=Sulfurivermis fontis TaxID=1972068 RepID=UPI000FDBE66B|nr:MarC family protein [Sulfurivermis fontis]